MALARKPSMRNSSGGHSDDPEEFRATLGEHLDELRSRILKIVYGLVAFSILGWFIAVPAMSAIEKVVMPAMRISRL